MSVLEELTSHYIFRHALPDAMPNLFDDVYLTLLKCSHPSLVMFGSVSGSGGRGGRSG